MPTKLRLARFGCKHRPFYRIVATDSRKWRDGKPTEYVRHQTQPCDGLIADTSIRLCENIIITQVKQINKSEKPVFVRCFRLVRRRWARTTLFHAIRTVSRRSGSRSTVSSTGSLSVHSPLTR